MDLLGGPFIYFELRLRGIPYFLRYQKCHPEFNNNKMNIDKDKMFSMIGSRTKNSLFGNRLRWMANYYLSELATFIEKELPEKEIDAVCKKHNILIQPYSGKGQAYYNSNTHYVGLTRDNATKSVIAHEFGHALAGIDKESKNSLARLYRKNVSKLSVSKLPIKERLEIYENLEKVRYDAEVEAWDEALRVYPELKNSIIYKIQRSTALGTYQRGMEGRLQQFKMSNDDDYLKKMMLRTTKKVAGATTGALGGLILAVKLSESWRKELTELSKKTETTEIRKRKSVLAKRIMFLSIATSGAGALAGYKLTKKYLTKSH